MSAHLTATFLFAENFMSHLKAWDTQCFLKINTSWTNAFADFFMPLVRDQRTWYPLYAFLLIYAIVKFKWKAVPFILLGVATVGLSDSISSHVLKDMVGRVRPCHEDMLIGIMKLRVGYCPNSGSFTSSHAANHFSLATFFYFVLKPCFKKWGVLFFLWAGLISYAQVYVGVHYPGDVLGGAILGILIGSGTAYLFKRYFNFQKHLFHKKRLQ
jgi:membrane-associated phospholipid phosphatase